MSTIDIVLRRPTSEYLRKYNRAEKYEILLKEAKRSKQQLVAWIEEKGLSEEVDYIGEPTAFLILSAVCTLGAAEQLMQAPCVESVSYAVQFNFSAVA